VAAAALGGGAALAQAGLPYWCLGAVAVFSRLVFCAWCLVPSVARLRGSGWLTVVGLLWVCVCARGYRCVWRGFGFA
jgi:hypothetical protein